LHTTLPPNSKDFANNSLHLPELFDNDLTTVSQRFANGLPATARHLPTVCQARPSICQRFACDGQAFANCLLMMAKHVPSQQFACVCQAFANGLPVMAKHLPTVGI
jgi:hypothetical protein